MFTLLGVHKSIPFKPLKMLMQGDTQRQFVIFWFLCSLLIVPSSVATRYLDWTGMQLSVGGIPFFVTIYIPMLFCIPFAYWFGYWWAAIPAYFSSFLVALIGGMPIEWIFLFSFANPLTLLFHYLSLSVFIKHQQMTSITSFIGFVLTSFIATLAGSIGAFIWAWSNQVGFQDAIPVWQGWWFGGWLQAIFMVFPTICLLTPFIEKHTAPLVSPPRYDNDANYKTMFTVALVFLLILVGFVFITRHIGMQQLQPLKFGLSDPAQVLQIDNATTSLSYPLFILLAVMMALTLIMYKSILFWSQKISEANKVLCEKNAELEQLATIDSLSGVLVRRKIMEIARLEFERAKRNELPVAILMLDIDKFKSVNDQFGHLVGDAVIKQVAQRAKDSVRSIDFVGRYGGEEFLVCLPGASQEEADSIAMRLLKNVSSKNVRFEQYSLNVTVSIGLAAMCQNDADIIQLINAADLALLSAKSNGRNCIVNRD